MITRILPLLLLLLGCALAAPAQSDSLVRARAYREAKDYARAAALYKKEYSPNAEPGVYQEYRLVLLELKRYKEAEELVSERIRQNPNSPVYRIDLGSVYQAQGKEKKAAEQFDQALAQVNGDDMLTQQIASAFVAAGRDDYALRAYEQARELLRNPYSYVNPVARLYIKSGETEKAVNVLLDAAPGNMGGTDDIKATLLELLQSDPDKLRQAQKTVIKRINAQPENITYAELLIWLYTQKDDWEGALLQLQAIDERNREAGQRLIEFARQAMKAGRRDIADQALQSVLDKGTAGPLYLSARALRLDFAFQSIQNSVAVSKGAADSLDRDFGEFFRDYPNYRTSETLLAYAKFEAQYNDSPRKAATLLREAIALPGAGREFTGNAKLQLGDYLLINGAIWDASLLYSQVDKTFREDALGEEARYRNARLSYYTGDFVFAQGQLDVLKASTSELIANDALDLSVLITENIPPDSNLVPLQRFAYADLLLFQNRLAQAKVLLDSINTAFPKHPLHDDILMLRARIEHRERHYDTELALLKEVYTKFSTDVLADDALYRTASVYEENLRQPEKAKQFYEQLVIDFPGSSFAQQARQRLRAMAEGTNVVP